MCCFVFVLVKDYIESKVSFKNTYLLIFVCVPNFMYADHMHTGLAKIRRSGEFPGTGLTKACELSSRF